VRYQTLVTRILELSREDPSLLQQLEKFRRAVTVMFTDIKGSTEYFEHFGDIAGLAMVHECNDLLRSAIEHHQGRVIKTIGDAVMAAFDDCNESVRAAIAMQCRLRERNANRKSEDVLQVRIGLHYGTGIVKSDDVFGDVVNVASRVESIAEAGQVIISDSLRERISPAQFDVVFLGRFRLKGKSEDRELFQVRWADTASAPIKAHTIVTRPGTSEARLQRLTRDGVVSVEYPLTVEAIIVDSANGETDPASAEDPKLPAVKAKFSLVEGQPTVENVGPRGRIYIRLIATYTLEADDIVAMGTRQFKFVCKPEVVAAATTVGKTLMNVSNLLEETAADFLAINPDGSSRPETYPLREEEVTFGRTNATYTFEGDRLMSRSHARVYQRGEDFFLEDLSSRNGTFVLVRGKAPVPFGAPVLVGKQMFRIVPSSHPVA
jgi:class 3 adenylate cyclase